MVASSIPKMYNAYLVTSQIYNCYQYDILSTGLKRIKNLPTIHMIKIFISPLIFSDKQPEIVSS